MRLKLIRQDFTATSTIGSLYVNGIFACFILEDTTRPETDPKIFGKTSIPYGTYGIVVTKSNRFSKMAGHDVYLPLLLNVPCYEGVRIHTGNRPEDTEGCLLPGTVKSANTVSNSRTAFIQLNEAINNALKKGEPVTIEITK